MSIVQPQQQVSQPWQYDPTGFGASTTTTQPDQPMIQLGSSVRQTSGYRAYIGDSKPTKVKMEAPRFDGTEVNNWIRGVQYYSDHVGTPDDQHLHYVIMLFEPNVADWVWSYAANHEDATWFGFSDDVRRRFDPNCYASDVGLLKKLR